MNRFRTRPDFLRLARPEPRERRILGVLAVAVTAGLLYSAPATTQAAGEPEFGSAFWDHWGDGQAEICSYDLTFSRYREARPGTAVSIFVTETFSDEDRVKADPGVHAPSDEYPVMKLNLVRDFPTGVYDYNLMTSSFYALKPFRGRPAGSPMKVAFSSQEWCGHVYHQVLPDERTIRSSSHSYFDREGDQNLTVEYPENGILEDGLFHWARGFAAPTLAPGESVTLESLRSLDRVRLSHVPLEWESAELSRGEGTATIEVPAGSFEVEERRVAIGGGPSWTFWVEKDAPHRIVRWETTRGETAELVASDRMKYWQLKGSRDLEELEKIGLEPRPARTP